MENTGDLFFLGIIFIALALVGNFMLISQIFDEFVWMMDKRPRQKPSRPIDAPDRTPDTLSAVTQQLDNALNNSWNFVRPPSGGVNNVTRINERHSHVGL